MNKYTLTFPFMGEYHFITITANQLANNTLTQGEDIFDFYEQHPGQEMDAIIYHESKEYYVEFSYGDLSCFNIYEKSDDENVDGSLVKGEGEKIPWLLVKIEDEEGNKLYGLSDYV